MQGSVADEIIDLLAFADADLAHLRRLSTAAGAELASVADRVLRALASQPSVQPPLGAAPGRIDTLREALLRWLQGLFSEPFDAAHWRERAHVGRTHRRAGVPLHLMVAGLELVRQELLRVLSAHAPPDAGQVAALHKLLAVEAAVVLGAYQEEHDTQVRQSERNVLQERLREAQQLAHIGQLAASLAHEIKNPLAGISGAIQVIRASLRENDPHWPVLGEVLRQINRLDRSVKDLLVYARPRPPHFQRCDVRRVIERVLTLLRKEADFERVRFEYRVPRNLPTIAADENQLEQLLMNLLLNAAQASTAGGTVRLLAAAHDSVVQLLIEDRGSGMTEEVARRAEEPFFTTKARGTGLGLPICRKIVDAHGGSLSIRSAPGAGTEVTVELLVEPPGLGPGSTDEHPRTDR